MIKIVRNNVKCKIVNLTNPKIIKQLDKVLSYYQTGYQFTPSYKSGRWDGRYRLLYKSKNQIYTFLSGLLPYVEAILKNNGCAYEIKDERKEVKLGPKLKLHNLEQRDYQQRAIEAAVKNQGGMIKIATGGGKTAVMAGIIAEFNVSTIVFVPGIDLLYQTQEALERFLGIKVGLVGDGKAEIRKINVCTIWSCVNALGKKYEKSDDEDYTREEKFIASNKEKIARIIKDAELFLVDECQFLGTSTLQAINSVTYNALFRFGLSATAFREDNAGLLLEGAVGQPIIEVTATELIKKGWLVEPTIHLINVPKILNLPDKYHSVYKRYIVENDVRNEKIIKAASKLVKSGRKVLVLVKNISHGKILLEELEQDFVVYFVRGEIKSDERNWVKKEFEEGRIDIIVASVVYDQGIDLPILNSLILAGGGASHGRTLQRLGRVIRPDKKSGKKDAIVVDFIDNATYLLKHTAKRMETYRTEAGFKIKLPKKGNKNGGNKKKAKKTKQLSPKNKWKGMSW